MPEVGKNSLVEELGKAKAFHLLLCVEALCRILTWEKSMEFTKQQDGTKLPTIIKQLLLKMPETDAWCRVNKNIKHYSVAFCSLASVYALRAAAPILWVALWDLQFGKLTPT